MLNMVKVIIYFLALEKKKVYTCHSIQGTVTKNVHWASVEDYQ